MRLVCPNGLVGTGGTVLMSRTWCRSPTVPRLQHRWCCHRTSVGTAIPRALALWWSATGAQFRRAPCRQSQGDCCAAACRGATEVVIGSCSIWPGRVVPDQSGYGASAQREYSPCSSPHAVALVGRGCLGAGLHRARPSSRITRALGSMSCSCVFGPQVTVRQ